MTTSAIVGLVIIVLIAVLIVWSIIASNKKRWYKVYTADNKCYLLYRDWNERMWRTNGFYLRFRDENNCEYTFPANGHWVLMMTEVKPSELEVAKQEIANMNMVNNNE